MRRVVAGSLAFLAFTGTLLVLPVYAAPAPEAVPVETSSVELDMGSVVDPAPEAEVLPVPSEPVVGAPADSPVLTLSTTSVEQFSLVGVTWAHDPAVTDTVAQVRVQDAAGGWGEWTQVTVEDADQEAGTDSGAERRGGTAPLWTGPSTGVEVELVTRSGARPTDVTLDLVDPGASSADGSLSSPAIQDAAHAALTMPAVYSRAQWGADESIRTWDPEYASTIRAATLHHTADTNSYTADQVPAMLRSIYRYHTVSRGWGDIGYNVVVDKYGRLWEGRYGGLSSTVVGAHAGGFNSGTFGVSMLGNYDLTPVPTAVVDAVAAVIAWKFSLYAVDPLGQVTLTSGGGGTSRYAAGQRVTLPTVFGHRDVGNTSCPGRYGYAELGDIRAGVAARVDASTSAIERRYAADGAARDVLGETVGAEVADGGGVVHQEYQRGRMYWSPTAGAHWMRGDVLAAYLRAGGPGALGAPVADEGPAGHWGAYQPFEAEAAVYWTGSTGAQLVRGAIASRWRALGAEWGLGFPTGAETALGGGAVRQEFTQGAVLWSSRTGAHELRGGIAAYWSDHGGLPALGLPTTGEVPVPGGVTTRFAGGSVVVWSPERTVRVRGGVLDRWTMLGGAGGVLGLPTSEEVPVSGARGQEQSFVGGSVVWTRAAGPVVLAGATGQVWEAAGGTAVLGLPTADARTTAGTTDLSFDTGAHILTAPGSGTHLVRGAVAARWAQAGGVAGLGVPATDETSTAASGAYQVFVRAKILWGPTTGAHVLIGGVAAAYDAVGAEHSRLGLPVTSEYPTSTGVRMDFQGGSITWSARTGQTSVTYR